MQRLARLLRERDTTLAGFVTEEIREAGRRVGFAIETLGGERGTLADLNLPGPPRVSRYGVAIGEFERLALPALRVPADAILIDELGKMELASAAFRDAVTGLIEPDTPSSPPCTPLATRSPTRSSDGQTLRSCARHARTAAKYLACLPRSWHRPANSTDD